MIGCLLADGWWWRGKGSGQEQKDVGTVCER